MRRPHLDRLLAAAHRRRIGAGLALLAVVGVVVAIVLVTQSSTPPGASAASQASGSTAVQRRNLVATDTESGTLSYAAPQTVYDRLSGTITWLPSIGQVIRPGQALFKVAGQPVILMNGSTPAYRNLNASDTAGPDILQLNRNLVALGFNPDGIVVDDTWQAATTAAVEVFQQSLGQSPTGDLSLGQIVFLPGAQVVTTVQANLGSGGGGGTGSPAAAADRPASPGPEFVSLTTTTPSSGTPTTTTPGTSHKPKSTKHHPGHSASGTGQSVTSLQALIALLRAEIAELKAAPHSGSPSSHGGSPSSHSGSPSSHGGSPSSHSGSPSSHSGSPSSHSGSPSSNSGSPSSGGGNPSGGGGGNATAVLQTASTELVATVALDASKQSEARVGEKVTVEMPAGNTVNGTITAVSPVAQSSSNSGNGNSGNGNSGNGNSGNGNSGNGNSGNGSSGATIPVTIALSGHQSGAGLDQASVSVNFMKSEANNVLSVPVTALLATGGGGYAIQNAAAPHNLIPVTTGLFAAGYVQISGSGIYPGLRVTDSQG